MIRGTVNFIAQSRSEREPVKCPHLQREVTSCSSAVMNAKITAVDRISNEFCTRKQRRIPANCVLPPNRRLGTDFPGESLRLGSPARVDDDPVVQRRGDRRREAQRVHHDDDIASR